MYRFAIDCYRLQYKINMKNEYLHYKNSSAADGPQILYA